MNIEEFRQANEIFEQVLDLPTGQRQAAIEDACAGNRQLLQAVERRLRADAMAEEEDFLAEAVAPSLSGRLVDSLRPERSIPERLGSYRILHVIGEGGMGTVYAAERDDAAFHRRVAIKVIKAGKEHPEIIRRMETERRILALLEHPNIARIYDAGTTEEGLPYFVMELVEGRPIDQYCTEQGSSLEERLDLVLKVCEAVDYANQNLVVHRDLKPSNILVTASGEPKLLDFGIAKLLDPPIDAEGGAAWIPRDTTEPWRQRVTLNYASPEQIRGQAISTAGDVYALGVLLFQLLTGALPRSFDNLSPWQAEERLTTTEPRRPSTQVIEGEETTAALPGARRQVSRALRGDLDSIVLKALRSEAKARYPSAALLAADLRRYRQGFPVLAHRGSRRYRFGKLLRRYRAPLIPALVALLLGSAFVGSRIVAAQNLAKSQARLMQEKAKLENVLQMLLGIFEDAGPYVSEGLQLTVLEAVDRQSNRFEAESDSLAEQPEVLATILSTLGQVYLELGQADRAESYYRRSSTLRQDLSPDSLELAQSLDGVAASLRLKWKLDEAEALNSTALKIYRRHAELDPAELLRSLNNRVGIYCAKADWQAADPISAEALALGLEATNPEDFEITKAMIQRALVVKKQGDKATARELYLEAVQAGVRHHGAHHPILATLYNNLGRLASDDQHPEEAVEYWQKADAQYVAAFGDDFYERIKPLINISKHYRHVGDLTKAESGLRSAIDVALRSPTVGPDSELDYYGRPAVALAEVLIETDRCSEVESLLGKKVSLWSKRYQGNAVLERGKELLRQCGKNPEKI